MIIPVLILYGSQTGASQDVARRIKRELSRLGFSPTLSSMDNFPINNLPTQRHVIFVCSTTGQGQVPDNMSQFWSFLLRADIPPIALINLRFSIFGLGDTSYPMYNAVARRLDKRLLSLGAQQFANIGLGDDQHPMGYDGGLIIWLQTLLQGLLLECQRDFPQCTEIITNLENTIKNEQMSMNSGDDGSQLIETDYLAFPTCAVNIIKEENFNFDEFSQLLTQSPVIRDLFYDAMVAPLPIAVQQSAPDDIDEFKDYIVTLLQNYITPNTTNIMNYTKYPYQYHNNNVFDLFSNDLLIEYISNYSTNTQIPLKFTNNNKSIPSQLSSKYKALPILTTTPLVSDQHKEKNQSVNHISYDFSPLQFQSTTPLNSTQNPPYLPGDTLEVIPPSPDILVNTMLTLYGLKPNDIALITTTNPQLHQALSPHVQPIRPCTSEMTENTQTHLSHPLFNEILSLSDAIFDIVELQDTLSTPILQRYETFPLLLPVWQLFTWYIALTLTPLRHHFIFFAQQATKPSEKERLTDLCSVDYASTLESYCVRERRSIVEVFSDFPSAILPLQWVVELCDRIKPRQFSLSSSSAYGLSVGNRVLGEIIPSYQAFTVEPQFLPLISTEIHTNQNETDDTFLKFKNNANSQVLQGSICLATVTYTTPFRRRKFGLCSTYLEDIAAAAQHKNRLIPYTDRRNVGYTINCPIRADLNTPVPTDNNHPNYRIFGRIKCGSFRYHISNHNHPILAIGPGTGVAALHAIVEHRVAILFDLILQWIKQGEKVLDDKMKLIQLKQEVYDLLVFNNYSQIATISQSSSYNQQYHMVKSPENNVVFHKTTVISQITTKLKNYNNFNDSLEIVELLRKLNRFFNPNIASMTILFGCRSITGDHFYRDFFNYAVYLGVISSYQSVFSRFNVISPENAIINQKSIKTALQLAFNENIPVKSQHIKSYQIEQVDNTEKVNQFYVQHIIENNPQLQQYLYSLIDVQYTQKVVKSSMNTEVEEYVLDFDSIAFHNHTRAPGNDLHDLSTTSAGTVIVAGNAKKMPVDVQHTIMNLVYDTILKEMADCDMEHAISFADVKKYINLIAKHGRYILECWM